MSDKQCPYLIDISKNQRKQAKCDIDDNICPYIRFCKDRNKIVSSPLYTMYGCGRQKKYEENLSK